MTTISILSKSNVLIRLVFVFLVCVFLSACQSSYDFLDEFKHVVDEVYTLKDIKNKNPIHYPFGIENIQYEKIILSQPYMTKETFENEGVSEEAANEIFKNLLSIERYQMFLIREGCVVLHEFLPENILIKDGYIVLTPGENIISLIYSEVSEKVLIQKLD